jgi:DNA invertase Pin-like site-specific DNA recombinase
MQGGADATRRGNGQEALRAVGDNIDQHDAHNRREDQATRRYRGGVLPRLVHAGSVFAGRLTGVSGRSDPPILALTLGQVHSSVPPPREASMISPSLSDPSNARTLVRAAEYVRMSMENSKYSIANQQAAIREYALVRNLAICRTYSDAGRTGLTLRHRPALAQLLKDVVSGERDYDVIVVYDVSRWGRFQDTDESAHYEYLCRSANVAVEYCAESFGNDGPLSAMLKNLTAPAADGLVDVGLRDVRIERARRGRGVGPGPIGCQRRQAEH